ncbi:MAG: hypothetical protein ABIK83_11710 [Candidatus Zixiibacteriota bacterium]
MKTKILLLITLLLMVLIEIAPGQAYYGLDRNWLGSGVRARSMGGAFIGLANDASAITWNPAGLIQTLDPQICFSGSYTRPNSTIDLNYGTFMGGRLAVNDNRFNINYASFLAPLTIKEHQFSASIAYQKLDEINHAEMQNPYIYVPIIYYQWDSVVVSHLEEAVTGGMDVVNLGFGTSIMGGLAVGAAANIYIGTADENYDVTAEWMDTKGAGQYEQDVRRLFRAHSLFDVSYSGFNMTFGLHYTWNKLKIGAVAKTPFEITRKYDIIQNDTIWETATDLYVIVPQSDKADFFLTDKKQKLEQPLTLGMGLAYNVKPNFVMSGDFEWRRFGRTSVSVLYSSFIRSSGQKDEFYTKYPSGFRNAGEGRIGFEYTLESDKAKIPIRGGFRYIQHYDADVDMTITLYGRTEDQIFVIAIFEDRGDRMTAYALSAGTGVHWSSIWLDAGFEYYTQDRTVVGHDGVTLIYTGTPFTGDNKLTRTRFSLNFTGFF